MNQYGDYQPGPDDSGSNPQAGGGQGYPPPGQGYAPPSGPGYPPPPPGPAYPQQYGYGPPQGFRPMPPGKPTSGKAIASLVLGIAGFFVLPIVLNIPGMILGFLGLRETKANGPRLGRGMALAGTIINACVLLLGLAVAGIVVGVIMYEEAERQERIQRNAEADFPVIYQRLKTYYEKNDDSLEPGGPWVNPEYSGHSGSTTYYEPWSNSSKAQNIVSGRLEMEHLVGYSDLRGSPYDYSLVITGKNSARVEHWSGDYSMIIRNIGTDDYEIVIDN